MQSEQIVASRNSLLNEQIAKKQPNLKQFSINRFMPDPSVAYNTDSATDIQPKDHDENEMNSRTSPQPRPHSSPMGRHNILTESYLMDGQEDENQLLFDSNIALLRKFAGLRK
jgi:hypothetical protein